MQEIELKKSTVSLMDNGIMHIHLKSGVDIELCDAAHIVEAMGKLGSRKKYPVLIDAGEFVSIEKEAQVFSAAAESNIYTLADAIAYYNLGQKLLAEFYVKYNKPVVPTRVFDKKTEAVTWLQTFIMKGASPASSTQI